MREKISYSLGGKEEDKARVYEIIYRRPNPYSVYSVDNIYTDTELHKVLLKACEAHNVTLEKGSYQLEFSKQELDSSEYLELYITSMCPCYPKECGTIYTNETACKFCGAGKTPISDFRIDKTHMKKKLIAATYSQDIIIENKLYEMLNDAGFSGMEFTSVKHKHDKLKDELIYFKFESSNVLPPLNQEKSEFLYEKYCKHCRKSGLHLRSPLFYNRTSLSNAKDFNYTHEYFGSGFAGRQALIISHRVYQFFINNKIRGVKFNAIYVTP
jgi:hypothetical protein